MRTIHLISHTHWDREWYLTFQQFHLKLVQLIDNLLDILEADKQYQYFLLDGQTIILEDYLQVCPEREAEIVRHVQNGRLFIGPWYISPDEFLIPPEGHIRNLLEGDRLCHKYGGKMAVGYLPDTFGHIGQMPQILQGFDISSVCVWRGLDEEPCELNWSAPDGSTVLLSYLRESYSNAANLTTSDPDKFIHDINELTHALAPFSSTDQILLMNGTDHMEPSRNLSTDLSYYQAQPHQDQLVQSNLPAYFDAIQNAINTKKLNVPTITGELRSSKRNHLLPNVLSTRIILKQRNHSSITNLLKWTEPLTALSTSLEKVHPSSSQTNRPIGQQLVDDQKSIIRYVWKLLMQCHPHDSICGTAIDQVAKEMLVRFDQVDQLNEKLIDQDLYKVSTFINTELEHHANTTNKDKNLLSSIIVFNPNDTPQSGVINLDIKVDKKYSAFSLIDEINKSIPYEQKGRGSHELISMTLDKKALKQALGMIHEGRITGMVIHDFEIKENENQVEIIAVLSDHGLVDLNKWKMGINQLEQIFLKPEINEFIIHAYSDPETEISFIAQDIPAHGYRNYWVQGKQEDNKNRYDPMKLNPLGKGIFPIINLISKIPFIPQFAWGQKSKSISRSPRIENRYFSIEVQHSQGTITITDKQTKQKYRGHNLFSDSGDCGDLYNYCPPEQDITIHPKILRIEVEKNLIGEKLIITYEMKVPERVSEDRKSRIKRRIINKIVSTITLVSDLPRIDIHTEIYNQAKDHRMRVHFPAPFHCDYSFHDGHYEIVKRQIGLPKYDDTWAETPRPEVPQGDFTYIRSGELSLTLVNRGLPEVEVTNDTNNGKSEIILTLLRSVGWLSRDDLSTRKGHAGPMGIETPEAQMIGYYAFDYAIIPGGNNISLSIQQAQAFNAPLKSLLTTIHSGILPSKYSFVQNNNPDFCITAIKLTEHGDNLLIRGYNSLSSPIDVKLILWKHFTNAHVIRLDEKIIHKITITPDGEVSFQLNSNKIVTLQFSD